ALARQESNPFLVGMILRRYGTYLLGVGRRDEGLAHLGEAQAILARIGARGELAKIEKVLFGTYQSGAFQPGDEVSRLLPVDHFPGW
ncbi:MAG: hypothetical protein HY328_02035, partial [Chloroflexi bacterium]|nr:hypothetical protein [Chloroflexota bacterium]